MDSSKQKKSENIQKLRENVNRSWWEDGMFEISFGILMFFIGLGYFVPKIPFLPDTFLAVFSSRIILIVIGVFGFFWLNRKFKEKFVWGKTGYSIPACAYSKSVKISISIGFLCYLLALFALFSRRLPPSETAILSTGFAISLAYITLFFQSGRIRRFLLLSFLPIISAAIIALLKIFYQEGIYLMFFIIGSATVVSGIIVYEKFRRNSIR